MPKCCILLTLSCAVNEELEDAPENLRSDPYGSWIIKAENITEEEKLLAADEYEAFCASCMKA